MKLFSGEKLAFITGGIILFVLFILPFSLTVEANEDWQEKELDVPARMRHLIDDFSLLEFVVEFDREDSSQKVEYRYEILQEEIIEGNTTQKTELTIRGEDQDPDLLHVWYDNNYVPVKTEMDGNELPVEIAHQYIEPILNTFIRLEDINFLEFPDIDFEYLGQQENFWSAEIPVHKIEVPQQELSDSLRDDFVVKLAEFENSLAVVYYKYRGFDAEPVDIEFNIQDISQR